VNGTRGSEAARAGVAMAQGVHHRGSSELEGYLPAVALTFDGFVGHSFDCASTIS